MRINFILSVLTLLLIGTACKKKGCTDPLADNYSSTAQKDDGSCTYTPTYSSNFDFISELNGASFLYDTIIYSHPAGYPYSVQTLTYFVSDIVLYKTNGDSVFLDMEHYVDDEISATKTYEYTQSIENTSYTGVGFVFGLNETKNVTGAFSNPPESYMMWPDPMGGGYHYMKFEGKYDSIGLIKSYNIHTGALNGIPHHIRVDLAEPFTVIDNQVNMEFIMELNNWFQNPAIYDFDVYGQGIMGSQAAQDAIEANGIDVFSVNIIN